MSVASYVRPPITPEQLQANARFVAAHHWEHRGMAARSLQRTSTGADARVPATTTNTKRQRLNGSETDAVQRSKGSEEAAGATGGQRRPMVDKWWIGSGATNGALPRLRRTVDRAEADLCFGVARQHHREALRRHGVGRDTVGRATEARRARAHHWRQCHGGAHITEAVPMEAGVIPVVSAAAAAGVVPVVNVRS